MTSTSLGRCAVVSTTICIVISTTICIVIMLGSVVTPLSAHASSHHQTCKSPYTKLYVYTFPPKTECVLLKHTGNVVEQNKLNMEYNAGVVAGQKASQGVNFTSWKCPADHTKSFCEGWNSRGLR